MATPPTLHEQTEAIGKKLDKLLEQKETKLRDGVLIAIITAILSIGGWVIQSTVQKHIDEAARELTTRLAITQQFYARKLAVYEDVHQQVANLISSLADARFNKAAKGQATDSLHNLYIAYTRNSLYLSNDLIGQLQWLVTAGNDLPTLNSSGKTTMKEIDDIVSAINRQMKNDLQIDALGKIPELEKVVR